MNVFYVFTLMVILFLSSCASNNSINIKTHDFNRRPLHVVWFQLPGFDEEQIALLRFSNGELGDKVSYERSKCIGKIWNYNSYELRPSSEKVLLSQILGTKNIKTASCLIFENPIWAEKDLENYSVYILEAGNKSSTNKLREAWSCKDHNPFNKRVKYLRMQPFESSNDNLFHQQEKIPSVPGIYYDKSCQKNGCFSSITSNVDAIFNKLKSDDSSYFFIIQDYHLEENLKNKNFIGVTDSLRELEKLYAKFISEASRDHDMLVLITTATSTGLVFPAAGNKWEGLEKTGSYLTYMESKLQSPVFADGASAENFCGMYEADEIRKRLFWSPPKKRLWDYLF